MRDHQDIFDEMQEELGRAPKAEKSSKEDKAGPKELEVDVEKVLPTFPPRSAKRVVKVAKKGGYVRAADGIAQRGKTRGRIV